MWCHREAPETGKDPAAVRAVAGVTYPLVDKAYPPDAAAAQVTQGLTPAANRYLPPFPYLGTPHDGLSTPS